MKIKLEQIPEEGLEINASQKVRMGNGETVQADCALIIEQAAGEVLIRGDVSASFMQVCSRCLKEFQRKLDITLALAYCREEDYAGGEKAHEVTTDETNTAFFSGDELDIGDIVSEQVVLEMPMKSLCDEKCKGICSKCGANLNEVECGCEAGTLDPRLRVLEEYLKKKKE